MRCSESSDFMVSPQAQNEEDVALEEVLKALGETTSNDVSSRLDAVPTSAGSNFAKTGDGAFFLAASFC